MTYFDVALDAINTATSLLKRDNDMNQQDDREERMFNVLCKVAQHITQDELSLLCWGCGISRRDVMNEVEIDYEPSKRTFFLEDAIDAADLKGDR